MSRRTASATICLVLLFATAVASAQSTNVALQSNGGTATAINYGTYMGDPQYPWEAIDGSPTNGWSSNWSCPAWLKVEFDDLYPIDRVAWWTGSHQHDYSISLSADNTVWNTVVPSRRSTNIEGQAPEYESFSIPRTDARYMKIDITSTSAPGSHIFQSSVGELEAYIAQPRTHVLSVGVRDVSKRHLNDITAREVGDAFSRFRSVESVSVLELASDTSGLDNRDAVVSAIYEAEDTVKPGDTFVFYVATHGYYEKDGDEFPVQARSGLLSREETTGDEYLWMARSGGAVNISDDMLHSLFSSSKWDQVNKLFIIDTCFSGGFWGSTDMGDSGDLATLPKSALIAAAAEEDVSIGVLDIPNLGARSAMGFSLVDALDELSSSNRVTFDQLAESIGNKMKLYEGIDGEIMAPEDFESLWGSEYTSDGTILASALDDFEMALGVPEPASIGLLALGGLALLRRRRAA